MIVWHNCLYMFLHVQESNLIEKNLIFHWEEMYILRELFRNHFALWSLKSVHRKNKFWKIQLLTCQPLKFVRRKEGKS